MEVLRAPVIDVQVSLGLHAVSNGTYIWHTIRRNNHRILESAKLFCFPLTPRPNVGHGLLVHDVSRSHTTTHHSREDSSGRVISPSQRPLPDNTHPSRQTYTAPVEFEPTISAGEWPQTYALDRAVTGIGICQTLAPKDGRLHVIRWRHRYLLRPQHAGFETG